MIRLSVTLALFLATLLPAFAGDAGADPTSFAAPLDEGRTYRKIDSLVITGKDLADILVQDRWEEEISSFVKQVVVEVALEKSGLRVTPDEEAAELKRLTSDWARSVGKDVQNTRPEEMAQSTRTSIANLHEEVRNVVALKRLLLHDKKLTEKDLSDTTQEGLQKISQAMQAWLEHKVKESEVLVEGKRLGEGEAVRISGRPYSKETVRAYILRRLGPLKVGEIQELLKQLTMERLVQDKLKAAGKGEVSREDSVFHMSYLCRRLEFEQKIPNGFETISMGLRVKNPNMTPEKWMENRTFIMDAGITKLARRTVGKKAIEEEWKANSKAYQDEARFIAHIFLPVRDPEGRKYNLFWRATGHKELNEYVGKLREEQFAAARSSIEQLVGAANADFEKTAKEKSEDNFSKNDGGRIGIRVGEGQNLQPPLDDPEFVKEVLKLRPGQISVPIRSAYGWHIVKCLENQETRFEETKTQEHIYQALLGRKRKEVAVELQSILDDKQRCIDTY
jgi:hypothetical protein